MYVSCMCNVIKIFLISYIQLLCTEVISHCLKLLVTPLQMVTIHIHHGGNFVKGKYGKLAYEWSRVDVLPGYDNDMLDVFSTLMIFNILMYQIFMLTAKSRCRPY